MSWDRRNKPRARQSQKLPAALRKKIIQRDRSRGCWFKFDCCTELRGQVEIHHIFEAEDGGTDDPENLTLACKPCHTRHSARQAQKRAARAGSAWKRQPERHPGLLD